ncbi:MAG: hypothetical protein J0M12_10580 [Deltaproteobacteria bacterium]|nr:hypothetical protein [Deltaproteobacteria bacterium]
MKKVKDPPASGEDPIRTWEKGETARRVLLIFPTVLVCVVPALVRWPVRYLLFSTASGKALSISPLAKDMIVQMSSVVVVLIGGLWLYRRLLKQRSARDRLIHEGKVCPGCGYPIGTGDRCPECGKLYER